MRWIDAKKAALLLAITMAGLAGAAGAEVVVLRAAGPSAAIYAPGHAVPDAAKIVLKPNDELVLLDARGTRTLRGPGSFVAGASGSAAATSLASLAGARTDRQARIGAVRGGADLAGTHARPNIWFVDAAAAGNACVTDPKAVTIWRAGAETAGATIVSAPGGPKAELAWIKGQATQPWPAALPVADGAEYRLTGTGAPAGGTPLTFRLVAPVSDMPALGAALATHGCRGQVDVLIAASNQAS